MNKLIKGIIVLAYVWVYIFFPTLYAGYSFQVDYANDFDLFKFISSGSRSAGQKAFDEDSSLSLTIHKISDRGWEPEPLKTHQYYSQKEQVKRGFFTKTKEEFLECELLDGQITYRLTPTGTLVLTVSPELRESITISTPFSAQVEYGGIASNGAEPPSFSGYMELTALHNQKGFFCLEKGETEITLHEASSLERLRLGCVDPLLIKGSVVASQLRLETPSLSNHGTLRCKDAFLKTSEIFNKADALLEGEETVIVPPEKRQEEEGSQPVASLYQAPSLKILHNEGEIYWEKVSPLISKKLINSGTIHTANSLEMIVEDFNNNEGTIGSHTHTFLSVTKGFKNEKGTIGSGGTTELWWRPPVFEGIRLDARFTKGLISGDETFLNLEGGSTLPLKGRVVGKSFINLANDSFQYYEDLEFHTPLLEIKGGHPRLSPQLYCDLIQYYLPYLPDIRLCGFVTNGRFEIWEDAYGSQEEVLERLEKKLFWGVEPGILRLEQSFEAAKGIGIYAPNFKLHLKDQNGPLSTNPLLDLSSSDLEAFVRAFDLEQGAIVARNATIIAPSGIHIGRLIEDPTRDIYATFYSHQHSSYSHNLGGDIQPTSYQFLGKEYGRGVYDGHHLLTLPVAVSNNATFKMKDTLILKGPLVHQGAIETRHLDLAFEEEAKFSASSTHVSETTTFYNKGPLSLEREMGHLTLNYYMYNGGSRNGAYNGKKEFVVSNPATFKTVNLLAQEAMEIKLYGSELICHTLDPKITLDSHTLTSSLYQEIVSRTNRPSSTGRSITHHSNSIVGGFWDISIHHAHEFLRQFNNFERSQNTFPAVVSSGSPVVLENAENLEGSIAAPALLMRVGDKNLNLGSLVLSRPLSKPTRVSLSEGYYNSYTVYMNAPLEALRRNKNHPNPASFYFKYQERYWHDHADAQAFYEPLRDHLMVWESGRGFTKAELPSLFTLSPTLLLEKVTEKCLEILNRAFFEISNNPQDNKIDATTLHLLHFNMTEYLREIGYYADPSSQTLSRLDMSRLVPPTKPVLYYLRSKTPEGIIELEPQLIFPQKMVDEANGLSGVKINTNFLGIAPKGMGLTTYLQYFSTAPLPIQDGFTNMVRTQPVEVINYLLNPPTSLIDTAHQETDVMPASYSASSPVPFMLPTGSVNLLGEIGAKTSLIMAPSNLTFTGTFTGTDAYVMALNNLLLLSLKERHTHGRGYQDHLTYKTTLKLKKLLLVLSGQNLGTQGVSTQSGEHTALVALGNLLTETLVLESSSQEDIKEGRKKGTKTTHTRTHVGNEHVSKNITTFSGQDTVFKYTTLDATDQIEMTAQGDIHAQEVHNYFSQHIQTSQKKSGFMSSGSSHQTSTTSSLTSLGNTFKSPTINASAQKIIHEGSLFQGQKTLMTAEEVHLNAGTNTRDTSAQSQKSGFVRSSVSMDKTHTVTYTPTQVEGEMRLRAPKVFIDQIDQNPVAWMKQLQVEDGVIHTNVLRSIYEHESFHNSQLSSNFCALICAAVSLAAIYVDGGATFAAMMNLTQGMFATQAVIVGVNAGIASLGSKFICDMANHGNPGQFFEDMTSSKGFRPFATSVLTAVGTAGLAHKFNLAPVTDGFGARLTHNLANAAVRTTVDTTIGQQSFPKSLRSNLQTAGIDTLSGICAQKIGEWYKTQLQNAQQAALQKATLEGRTVRAEDLQLPSGYDFVCHKAMHGAVGAVFGGLHAVIKDESFEKGMVSGAVASVVAETVSELVSQGYMERAVDNAIRQAEKEGRVFTGEDIKNSLDEEIKKAGIWGKAASVATAFVSGQDIDIARHMADNAVDNNILPLLFVMATVASGALTAYEIYDGYKKDGIRGAVEVLIKQGIMTAVGLGTLKAAKYGIRGGKMAFKFAGIEFPSAEMAWEAFLKSSPFVRAMVNKAKAADSFVTSKFQQATQKVEEKFLGKASGKIPDTGVKFHPDEQPWNVRPGQEWKHKIIGEAQSTQTPGHKFRTYDKAVTEAKKEDTKVVLLNRGINRLPGVKARPNSRPDATVVKKDNTVNAHEVGSMSDKDDILYSRSENIMNNLPSGYKAGDIDIDMTLTNKYKK